MRALVSIALAACSSDAAPPCADAAICNGACVATFAGNFTEVSSAAANCARLTPALELSVSSRVIGSPLAISLDLGVAPLAGSFSSETVTSWSAVQARSISNGACAYVAGAQAVPTGSFTLSLTSIDGTSAHGTLHVTQYVHAIDSTDCGPASNETVEVVF